MINWKKVLGILPSTKTLKIDNLGRVWAKVADQEGREIVISLPQAPDHVEICDMVSGLGPGEYRVPLSVLMDALTDALTDDGSPTAPIIIRNAVKEILK